MRYGVIELVRGQLVGADLTIGEAYALRDSLQWQALTDGYDLNRKRYGIRFEGE